MYSDVLWRHRRISKGFPLHACKMKIVCFTFCLWYKWKHVWYFFTILFLYRSNCDSSAANVLRKYYQKPYFLPDESESSKTDWIFMGCPGYGAHLHVSLSQTFYKPYVGWDFFSGSGVMERMCQTVNFLLWRKLISYEKILAIMETAQNFSNCQKLKDSAQNALWTKNQAHFWSSYLTTTLYDCRIPWSAINFLWKYLAFFPRKNIFCVK